MHLEVWMLEGLGCGEWARINCNKCTNIQNTLLNRLQDFIIKKKTRFCESPLPVKCSSPSSKPLLTANGDCHRKTQLDTMQGSMHYKYPSDNRNTYIAALTSMEEETERFQEPEYQEILFETVSHRNNKIWTMLTSIDTLMLQGWKYHGIRN